MSDLTRRYAVSTSRINTLTDSPRSVLASVPFKFIVDGEPLYIHADLVSRHSERLERQVAEAQEGSAVLEDVDGDTFARFIEWAYKGHYTAANFTTVEIESPRELKSQNQVEVEDEPQQEYRSSWHSDAAPPADPPAAISSKEDYWEPAPAQSTYKKKKKMYEKPMIDSAQTRKEELEQRFEGRKYTVRQDFLQVPPPRPNQSPKEDYAEVFLSHARLHMFADKYDIKRLKKLTLEELHATIVKYTLYFERTGDIIALLRYVYGNPAEPREGKEGMRTLMAQYIGYKMDILMKDENFQVLMIDNGGPLLGDFMAMVQKRIS